MIHFYDRNCLFSWVKLSTLSALTHSIKRVLHNKESSFKDNVLVLVIKIVYLVYLIFSNGKDESVH